MSNEHDDSPEFEETTPEELNAFMDMADKFVLLANEMSRDVNPSKIAPAMLFASARYCAFMWHNYGQHLHSREETVGYLAGQFSAMLEDNLDALEDGNEHNHEHGPDCGHEH